MAKQRYEIQVETKDLMPKVSDSIKDMNKLVDTMDKLSKLSGELSSGMGKIKKEINDVSKEVKNVNSETSNQKPIDSLNKQGITWNKIGKEIGVALERVAKYTILYKAVRLVTDTISEQLSEIVKLRDSFIDLQRVSGITDSQVNKLINTSIRLSTAYGATTKEVAEIVKIWVQQGRTGDELNSLIENTILATKALGVGAIEASEGLTVLNKVFGATPDTLDIYISKLKNVESNNAIVAKDLVDAYRRVGGAASAVGIDIDQLNGLVTALSQTLRVSGGYAGNFFKVVFARLQRPDTVNYLKQINVLTEENQEVMSDAGALLQTIAGRWNTLNSAQQKQIGTLVGGVRRFSDVITLFNNYDDVLKATTDSVFSFNSAQEAVQKNLRKFEASVNSIKSSLQGLLVSFGVFNAIEGLSVLLRGSSKVISYISELNDGIGGLIITLGQAYTGMVALGGAIKAITAGSNPFIALAYGLYTLYTSSVLAGKFFKDTNTEIKKSELNIANLINKYDELNKSGENFANTLANKILASTENINREGISDEIERILEKLGIQSKVTSSELAELTKRVIEYKEASLFEKSNKKNNIISSIEEITDVATLARKYLEALVPNIDTGQLQGFSVLLNTIKREVKESGSLVGDPNSIFNETTYQQITASLDRYIASVNKLTEAQRKFSQGEGSSANEINKLKREVEDASDSLPDFISSLTEGEVDYGIRNLKIINNLVKNTGKEAQKASKNAPIDIQISANIDEIASSYKSYAEQTLKLIAINDKARGSYSDLSGELNNLAGDDTVAKNIANQIFGVDAVEKNAKEIIPKIKNAIKDINQAISGELVSTALDKRISDIIGFDFSQISSIATQIEAESQLRAIREKNAKISEQEIKIKKIQLNLGQSIAVAEREISESTDENRIKSLQQFIAIAKTQIPFLDELLEKTRKLVEEDKKRADISKSIKFLESLDAKKKELEFEKMILDLEFKGVDFNEDKIEFQNQLNEALKNGIINIDEYNKRLAEMSGLFDDVKEKSARNTLSSQFSSSFISSFGDIPNKLQQDRETAKQVGKQLEDSANGYARAIERYREAEINFDKTGSETFRQDMESAREEATKFKEEYNQAVEASKEITSQTAKLRDIFNEIGDIIKKKIFEQIADQLINQTGAIQSITNQVGTLLGYINGTTNRIDTKSGDTKPSDTTDKITGAIKEASNDEQSNVKAGVERGMGAVIPKLVNAFATSQLFRTQSGQTGSMIGSVAGQLGLLGGLSPVGGLVGGLVGDLFGSKTRRYNEVADLSIENAPPIERLTEAVIENTNQLDKINNRTIGAPADFILPRLSNLTSTGSTNISINVSGFVGNEQQLVDAITENVNKSLRIQQIRV